MFYWAKLLQFEYILMGLLLVVRTFQSHLLVHFYTYFQYLYVLFGLLHKHTSLKQCA